MSYNKHMLISFTVSNYKSILDSVTLNMVADETDLSYNDTLIHGSDGLLNPVSVIYGPNGSGKTTLLDAMKLLKTIVLSGKYNNDVIRIPQNRNASKDTPTNFKMIFEIGIVYILNLSILNNRVNATLECLDEGKRETVITINDAELNSGFCDSVPKNIIHFFSNLVVYDAIEDEPEHRADFKLQNDALRYVNNTQNPVQGIFFIDDNSVGKKTELFVTLLNAFGTGITRVEFGDSFSTRKYGVSAQAAQIHQLLIPETVYYGDIGIPIKDESSGTKRLIKTAFTICSALFKGDSVVLIDELDAGLHDMLSTEIVKQFIKNNKKTNCQLIFTTHNTNLMKSHMLRRDQIWFSQMTSQHTTELYSLSDLKNAPKPTADFAESYLNGKYGAVPLIPENSVQEEG